MLERILAILAGAVAGAAVGFLTGRARVCSLPGCNARTNTIVSIVAWTFFGAAVAWALKR